MAFFNKTKATGSNIANRIGQSIDSAGFDSKISTQKGLKNKYLSETGQIAYDLFLQGEKTFNDQMVETLQKIKDCDAEIERLEKEKEDNITSRKEERRANMAQAYDADDARDQERAEKAAQRKAEREKEE